MHWLELIRLRTIQAKAEQISAALEAHLESLHQETGLIGAGFYQAVSPGTDFNVALFWQTERMEPGGSLVARRILPVIREYGLADHTIWRKTEGLGFFNPAELENYTFMQNTAARTDET